MSENPHARIIVPMPADLLASIEDYRFTHRAASRSEAIRQLITLGLASLASPPATDDVEQPAPGFHMSDEMAERVERLMTAYGVTSEDMMIEKLLERSLVAAERGLKS